MPAGTSMTALAGRRVLVFGASGIVGGAVARGLLDAQATVIAPCRSEASKAKFAAGTAGGLDHAGLLVPVIDHSTEQGMEELTAFLSQRGFLPLDCCLACLGGHVPKGASRGDWQLRHRDVACCAASPRRASSGPCTPRPPPACRPALGRAGGRGQGGPRGPGAQPGSDWPVHSAPDAPGRGQLLLDHHRAPRCVHARAERGGTGLLARRRVGAGAPPTVRRGGAAQ